MAHFAWYAPRTMWLKAKLSTIDLYDEVVGAADRAGLGEQRKMLASGLEGDILEIGVGTGAMLPLYGPNTRVTGIDTDETFLERAKKLSGAFDLRVASAESLPFENASFDAVVISLVLCSVDSPEKVLYEIRRVLRPQGEVRLIEHVVSDKPVSRALMKTFDPVWLKLNGIGCRMSRDTEALLERSFDIVERHPFQVFAPSFPAFPMRRIRCVL